MYCIWDPTSGTRVWQSTVHILKVSMLHIDIWFSEECGITKSMENCWQNCHPQFLEHNFSGNKLTYFDNLREISGTKMRKSATLRGTQVQKSSKTDTQRGTCLKNLVIWYMIYVLGSVKMTPFRAVRPVTSCMGAPATRVWNSREGEQSIRDVGGGRWEKVK